MKTIITRNIPDDLHREFKIKCAQDDVSQQKKMIELMQGYVKSVDIAKTEDRKENQ